MKQQTHPSPRLPGRPVLAAALVLVLAACHAAAADTTVPIRPSPALESKGGTGTKGYVPFPDEEPFLKKVTEKEISLWPELKMPKPANMPEAEWKKIEDQMAEHKKNSIPVADYELTEQAGQYVGWCGIVREIGYDPAKDQTRLLVEHKYFDGLTDLHLHIVSIFGAGDFQVAIPGKLKPDQIKPLSLVRIYGKVLAGNEAGPAIRADYIRVWDWGFFTFMDYGKDKGNAKWRKLRTVDDDDIYDPRPDPSFYETRLGKR
ncbi:hypothetical protein [Luteolibacter marinus]|uniref:hypothetical protein n=1 Tax=Luteolibacter marinus TaxID=2776705 RepID=UPI0018663C40|nr:hypothetical protein [Luteolibacter marinus]